MQLLTIMDFTHMDNGWLSSQSFLVRLLHNSVLLLPVIGLLSAAPPNPPKGGLVPPAGRGDVSVFLHFFRSSS